ncbi:MAG: hypothetical protein A3J97_04135 [Spirochaetes bacterium RIFOXYC1_FULL_54_7]|nr:MAG: hypothetical protein A3J97_04135 [Spirochaetes bacterium RIFOXYC1_FULL_54_7]
MHIWYSGNSAVLVNDTEWAALVEQIGEFTQIFSLGLVGFGLTPDQLDVLYTEVLSMDPGAFTELDFRDCALDDGALGLLANLTALEYLGLANNDAVSDISALAVANLSTLQALDLTITSVTDLSPLQALHGLGAFSTHSHWGFDVNLSYLGLDLWSGTPNRNVVDYLITRGVDVHYEDGNILTAPVNIPASAFPDPALRAAMQNLVGKSFTGEEGGVTNADLLALTTIDFTGRNDAYSDLTGLELCDDVSLLALNNNDLSGCDLDEPAGSTHMALMGMTKLKVLVFWDTNLDSLAFIPGLSQLEVINLSGNPDLSYYEQKRINSTNFPILTDAVFTGYDSDRNGYSDDPMGVTDWDDFIALVGSFTTLRRLDMHGTLISSTQFASLYTSVLSTDPSKWTGLGFGSNLLDDTSLVLIANLPNLNTLTLWNNPGITDLTAIQGMDSLDHLNVNNTRITDLESLQALKSAGAFSSRTLYSQYDIDLTYAGLDLWPGTANRAVIDSLIGQGVRISYADGNTLIEPPGSGTLSVTIY